MLCVNGMYSGDLSNMVYVILYLNVSHLSICSPCFDILVTVKLCIMLIFVWCGGFFLVCENFRETVQPFIPCLPFFFFFFFFFASGN